MSEGDRPDNTVFAAKVLRNIGRVEGTYVTYMHPDAVVDEDEPLRWYLAYSMKRLT